MKYVPGLLVGQLSGKAGSTIASHNRNGSFLKVRTIPTNPNTDAQQAVRNRLAAASAAWRGLTSGQRAAWNAYATEVVLYDRQGVAYTPTGQQAFVSVNINTYTYSGSGTITTAVPIADAPAALLTMTVTAESASSLLSIAYTATPLGASTKLVIEATPCISPGINFIARNKYRQILVTSAAAASPAVATTAWVARYGETVEGKQIGVRAYVLTADGRASAPLTAVATVVNGA